MFHLSSSPSPFLMEAMLSFFSSSIWSHSLLRVSVCLVIMPRFVFIFESHDKFTKNLFHFDSCKSDNLEGSYQDCYRRRKSGSQCMFLCTFIYLLQWSSFKCHCYWWFLPVSQILYSNCHEQIPSFSLSQKIGISALAI